MQHGESPCGLRSPSPYLEGETPPVNAPNLAPDPQRVAAPILVQCSACTTLYLFLATPDQHARYYAERWEPVNEIFPAMLNSARGVLSRTNTCALCLMFTPTPEVVATLAPHAYDLNAATFIFRGERHQIITTRYLNNSRPALGLFRSADDYRLLTVNSPAADLEGDEVLIEEDVETAGLRAALAAQLIIEDEGRLAGDDRPGLYVCKLVNPLVPRLSDPQALIDAEASETLEGFVAGSDRRYRYVTLGEAAPQPDAADFEPVEEVEEWAPGAHALLRGLTPTDVLYVLVHRITRRRSDGKLFSRESGSTVAREVKTLRRPVVRIPHDPRLASELRDNADACAFAAVKSRLLYDPDYDQVLVVGDDYKLEELTAFAVGPPEENAAGLWSRMLDAGVFRTVEPYDADSIGGDATPPALPCIMPLGAIRDDLMVYALPAPPVYCVKLTEELWW